MIKHVETKQRAKIQILNMILILAVHTKTKEGAPLYHDDKWSFISGFGGDKDAPIGALCTVSAAPMTKWYLSWIRDKRENGEYLLESIEDGSLCWWSNVAIHWIDPKVTEEYDKFHWTDSQYQFDDLISRAFKKRNAYSIRQGLTLFHENKSVTVRARKAFLNAVPGELEKTFPDYTKVRLKDLLECYDEFYKEMQESIKKS